MSKKRTITTREQRRTESGVVEKIATHIVTGAHGYETLCTSGYNIHFDEENKLILNCEKLAENQLPVTCSTCFVVWNDVHNFEPGDFDTEKSEASFSVTGLADIDIK